MIVQLCKVTYCPDVYVWRYIYWKVNGLLYDVCLVAFPPCATRTKGDKSSKERPYSDTDFIERRQKLLELSKDFDSLASKDFEDLVENVITHGYSICTYFLSDRYFFSVVLYIHTYMAVSIQTRYFIKCFFYWLIKLWVNQTWRVSS